MSWAMRERSRSMSRWRSARSSRRRIRRRVSNQTAPLAANTVATHQEDKGNGEQKPKKAKHQHGNQKHPNQGQQDGATGSDPAETD